MNIMLKVIETRDASFDPETGECDHGACMPLYEWLLFLHEWRAEAAAECYLTEASISTMLCMGFECDADDAYLIAREYWKRLIPGAVKEGLEYEIARAGLEHADNFRVYRKRDKLMFEDFIEKEKRGCCGSFETSVFDERSGDTWVVGCNYGH